MKDLQKVCGLFQTPQLPRILSAQIFGGCECGYKEKQILCKRCIHNKAGYYSTAAAITKANINAAILSVSRARRIMYARKNGKR